MAATRQRKNEYAHQNRAAGRNGARRAYIDGNTVRKLRPDIEVLPREAEPKRIREVPRTNKKAVVMPTQTASEAKAERKEALKTICVVFAVFVMLAMVIGRYSIINANYLENYKLQANIDSMQEQINTLQLNIAVEDNLDEITRTAQEQLNMGFPNGNQVQYINVNVIEPKPVQEPVEENAFIAFINGAIEVMAGWFK